MAKLFSHKLSLVTQITWASISCLIHRLKKIIPLIIPASFLYLLGKANPTHKTTKERIEALGTAHSL
jgi:hypothetical protein